MFSRVLKTGVRQEKSRLGYVCAVDAEGMQYNSARYSNAVQTLLLQGHADGICLSRGKACQA